MYLVQMFIYVAKLPRKEDLKFEVSQGIQLNFKFVNKKLPWFLFPSMQQQQHQSCPPST